MGNDDDDLDLDEEDEDGEGFNNNEFGGRGKKRRGKAAAVAAAKKKKSKRRILESVTLHRVHGSLTAEDRTGHMRDFVKPGTRSVLLASDVVSRGIDLPGSVDWIIQYDPPSHVDEYLHRIGRTARCGRAGNSLLFLQPTEARYLELLDAKMGADRVSRVDF